MTGMNKVETKEYHPSVWTGKNMCKHVSHIGLDPDDMFKLLLKDQIQPNGIDLTVDKVFQQTLGPTLTKKKEFIEEGYLVQQVADDLAGLPDGTKGWFLDGSYYVIEWTEVIHVPDNAIGLIFPRSTLLRLGGTICTAVWDRGYKGKGRSGLFLGVPMLLERGTRLGQMIFIDAQEDEQLYDGQYLGENI